MMRCVRAFQARDRRTVWIMIDFGDVMSYLYTHPRTEQTDGRPIGARLKRLVIGPERRKKKDHRVVCCVRRSWPSKNLKLDRQRGKQNSGLWTNANHNKHASKGRCFYTFSCLYGIEGIIRAGRLSILSYIHSTYYILVTFNSLRIPKIET
jgi:hypothetical protein